MAKGSTLQQVTRWMGLIAAVCTIALGIVHMIDASPSLSWPNNFIKDNNAESWRETMFSFAPSVFVDIWTPLVMGLMGLATHFSGSPKIVKPLTADFMNFALWNVMVALFANFAYNGGLGIMFGIISLVTAVLGLVLAFQDNGSASLELSMK